MRILILIFVFLVSSFAKAQEIQSLSITLENVAYPYPVKFLAINIEAQDLRMAYMDIRPNNPNGKSILLFHGKYFGGYY
jgi:hypothetical protein